MFRPGWARRLQSLHSGELHQPSNHLIPFDVWSEIRHGVKIKICRQVWTITLSTILCCGTLSFLVEPGKMQGFSSKLAALHRKNIRDWSCMGHELTWKSSHWNCEFSVSSQYTRTTPPAQVLLAGTNLEEVGWIPISDIRRGSCFLQINPNYPSIYLFVCLSACLYILIYDQIYIYICLSLSLYPSTS